MKEDHVISEQIPIDLSVMTKVHRTDELYAIPVKCSAR